MILNKTESIKQKMKKSPLLAKIKFEPTFFQVLWRQILLAQQAKLQYLKSAVPHYPLIS
jgi:hypothetical protein